MKLSFIRYGESPVLFHYIRQIPGTHCVISSMYDVHAEAVWVSASAGAFKNAASAKRLARDAASGFDTGTVIPVDGGFSGYGGV